MQVPGIKTQPPRGFPQLAAAADGAAVGAFHGEADGVVVIVGGSRILCVTLCANMTETSGVTAISEQGGKEIQHGNDERFCSVR